MCCHDIEIGLPSKGAIKGQIIPPQLLNYAGRYQPQENETTANGCVY